jgi:hypothetical protein
MGCLLQVSRPHIGQHERLHTAVAKSKPVGPPQQAHDLGRHAALADAGTGLRAFCEQWSGVCRSTQRVRASSDLRQILCPYGEFLPQIVALRYRFEEKPSVLGRWTTSRSDLMGLRGMSEEGPRAPEASANPEGGRPQTR